MLPKFGASLPQIGLKYEGLAEVARECELLGFDSLWLWDHFLPLQPCDLRIPSLESWTTLTALASETKTLRLGILVTCNSYRYPSLLAKMGATFDVISGGRLEFAIGAGWYEEDYRRYGIPFPSLSVRIRQLEEALQIIKKMWTEDSPTFIGHYYTVRDAICNPKPSQKPHPPLWIGGKSKQMLELTARFADYYNCIFCTAEQYGRLLDMLRSCCRKEGRNYDSVGKSVCLEAIVSDDRGEIEQRIASGAVEQGISLDEYRKTVVAGSAKQCLGRIKEYLQVADTYFILRFHKSRALETGRDRVELRSLRVFAEEVMRRYE